MKAENLIFDDSCQRQVVKEVRQVLPHVGVAVLAKAFVIEAVNLGDLPALVIASEDSDPFPVAHFEADEQRDGLDGVVASVHVVTHEEVVGIRRLSSNFE